MPQPNILIVIADQLATHAVSCFGNDFAHTPNLDRLAAMGLRFERAYTPYPLCRPARAAFWTGRLPHQTRVLSNGGQFEDPSLPAEVPTLGSQLRAAGYTCVHFGKTHDHGSLRGFEVVKQKQEKAAALPGYAYNGDTWQDVATERQALEWLASHRTNKPWCCAIDLNNPHNICGFVAENREGCLDADLPDLPANHGIEDLAGRPKPVQFLCCSHRRQMQAVGWSERQWRQYRAAYRHFVEDFDARLGHLLDALAKRGDAANTTIFFWADHGDGMGAHHLVTKHSTFYEETTRVPLIVAGPGVTARGVANGNPLVSLIDIVPTLCELCSAEVPADLPARSFAPSLRGQSLGRRLVVSQWHTEWGSTIEPGRMLRTDRYKYTVYREGDGEELFDLVTDPGEMRNLVADPAHAATLAEHRALFADYCRDTDDDFATLEWKADPRWRAHPLGYDHHSGTCAPIATGCCQ